MEGKKSSTKSKPTDVKLSDIEKKLILKKMAELDLNAAPSEPSISKSS
jgi:hypothetical protein